MMRLGVNIDHVATVRQARRIREPDPVWAVPLAELGGADQITLHLREDRRHIQDQDVVNVMAVASVPVNLEMAVTDEMVGIAVGLRPHSATLVPERREEVTTEGGLDVLGHAAAVRAAVAALRAAGIKVSLFIDPDLRQVEAPAAADGRLIALLVDQGTFSGPASRGVVGAVQRFLGQLLPSDRVSLATIPGPGPRVPFTTNQAAVGQPVSLMHGHVELVA
ncbi:MAG: pyridoxine 5'-phosphate synthase, partial [Deltaproteobacteria bacterium]|nr:pyridoxine 5'-phosphate synthase [Deltaproteobacteria bacterium]